MARIRNAVLVLALASAVAVLVGCTGTASGRLTSLTLKAPVSGASIESEAGTATTDASGSFTIKGARLGSPPVTVTAPGFPPFRAQLDAERSGTNKVAEIVLQDAALTGRLRERAVELVAVASATVQIAGVSATLTPDGTFSMAGLLPGACSIKVSSPSHETTESTPTLKPGSNEATVTLCLTPLETYRRYFAAGQYHRESVTYLYTHPDERKFIKVSGWAKMNPGEEDKSIRFGTVKMLPTWKSPVTKKTYRNVASIDRTIEGTFLGAPFVQNYTQNWAKL